MRTITSEIPFRDALHLKSAELWLRLGERGQALLELTHLTEAVRSHPWTVRTLRAICRSPV